ncbi:PAS domain-containing sensor histidine kinase [Seonamhaeicola maritimus]|uniref:PAS domain-containing sensor histidine kinase n=1 Tax=Seonamhaeicola maritimus TaxID=2591822 RepID=UPI002495352C|nr:PAS domain S-box protein [Seonamhaeicola maritimus]
MSQDRIDILERALKREKKARKAAEKILEQKSTELYYSKKKIEELYKEVESELTKTDSQLQGVFENIVDAYVIIDIAGNILKMNATAAHLFDFESDKSDGNLMNMVLPEDIDYVSQSFKSLQKEGSIKDFKINIKTNKNDIKLVHVNASIIYDKGIAVAAQGILRDITQDNKYQKSLEAEREKYRAITANMNLGLLEVNNNDEILLCNSSFCEMSGYAQEELLGKVASDLFLDSEVAEIIKNENLKRQKGDSNSYELKIKNKLGEIRYWLVSGAPNYNFEGKVIGSIGIHLDITAFKKLQEQKEKLLIDLEKSNNELHEYAHVVSHDLKSPLRSINALVSWLKEDNFGKLDEMSLKNFGLIESTLEKMEQLISNILTYSSLGEETQSNQPVNLNDVLLEIKETIYMPEHISLKANTELPIINGDKTKLEQLFQNLIGNAIKYCDKAEGFIEVNCRELDQHYEFSVKDNGIGIEEKHHEKIFKIFNYLNKSKDSSGIGLSIVKKIVDLHCGDIWLESSLGTGSTFFFTLKK